MNHATIGLLLLLATATTAGAGNDGRPPPNIPIAPDRNYQGGIVDRSTAIEGCMAWINDLKNGGDPTEWLERNKERLRDLQLQFSKENFPNKRELLMGAAVNACMRNKGFHNGCVPGAMNGRDRDLRA